MTFQDGLPASTMRQVCDLPPVHEHPFRLRPGWPQQAHLWKPGALDPAACTRTAVGFCPAAFGTTSEGGTDAISPWMTLASWCAGGVVAELVAPEGGSFVLNGVVLRPVGRSVAGVGGGGAAEGEDPVPRRHVIRGMCRKLEISWPLGSSSRKSSVQIVIFGMLRRFGR